jgi:hypothetical protein
MPIGCPLGGAIVDFSSSEVALEKSFSVLLADLTESVNFH